MFLRVKFCVEYKSGIHFALWGICTEIWGTFTKIHHDEIFFYFTFIVAVLLILLKMWILFWIYCGITAARSEINCGRRHWKIKGPFNFNISFPLRYFLLRSNVMRIERFFRSWNLFFLFQRHVMPGTMINSDEFASYVVHRTQHSNTPYQHQWVNHTQNFVCLLTGANHVEGFWKQCKAKNKAMNGTTAEMLPSYLDEFIASPQWNTIRIV